MNINVACADIRTPVGFEYKVPPDRLNHISSHDCKQSWYLQNRLIADSLHHQILTEPAISVSSDRLFTSRCVDELRHECICHSADGTPFSHEILFRVRNETAVTPDYDLTPDLQPSDQFWRLWTLPIIAVLMISIGIRLVWLWCRNISRHKIMSKFVHMSEHLRLGSDENESSSAENECDNRLLADPATQKLMDPVISVSSDRLVTSRCVDELRHQIHCDTSAFTLDTIFRVRNETAVTPNSDQLWWISVLIFIFLLVLICFLLRKRIFRCFQFICQRKAPENRDLEMLRSDHPRIGSVNQFSESAQCPDADRHLVV
ncbi:hypothetical protein Q8A67_001535 [Cirrhinus molitorella]|uniref:Uncharacterized protein n=1 Tax=Cirrhinus molitorella TaxID=172907 RepID=A0AA88Q9Z5_9TELE|nr:hypothetical protein Q8A67_001535 [Cirrhinus molitorella]